MSHETFVHPRLTAKYVLLQFIGDGESQKAIRHGVCTADVSAWSGKTEALLKELMASMEKDLLKRHFVTVSEAIKDERTGSGEEGADQV